jgi:RNA polymerase sigma factor (sigma-70 family)
MIDVTQYESVIKTAIRQKRVRSNDREDLTQECYLALLERQEELEQDPGSAEKICRTRIDYLLGGQYQTKEEYRIRFVSADLPSVAHLLSKIESKNQGPINESELYEAIETLDPEDRDVIKAVYIDGLSTTASAKKLEITFEAARWRKNRGIIALRQKFEV